MNRRVQAVFFKFRTQGPSPPFVLLRAVSAGPQPTDAGRNELGHAFVNVALFMCLGVLELSP